MSLLVEGRKEKEKEEKYEVMLAYQELLSKKLSYWKFHHLHTTE